MKRKSPLYILMALSALFFASPSSDACTNVIISKGASVDGSCMVSYAADSHWLYGSLYHRRAADWKAGDMLNIIEWDTFRPTGSITQVPHTFQTIGNMNEHQLVIAETTWGGREEQANANGIMDYGSLIYVTLQRAKTAREAISIIVELANEYGYPSEGESFSIADTQEAWVMDLVGKGKEKGIVWVARRIPDGYICAHANQARITKFPLDDPDNCLYAPDVISFARKAGYFKGKDKDFSFREAYNPLDFGGVRGCDARAWSAFNILCDGQFTYIDENGQEVTKNANEWLEYAMGHDLKGEMPLFVKPSRKLSVKDIANVMRDHFEGTPMDMTADIGAGGNALPYRWRPMNFTSEGKTYVNERAIATQQTGFWFVSQSRGYLPDEIGGIIWFGTDDAATSYITPIYTNTEYVPECFDEHNGDLLHYSSTASFWINNRIANACYKMYNQMQPYVRERIDAFENAQIFGGVQANDKLAMEAYNRGDIEKVKEIVTNYSVETAQNQFNDWVKLEETLLVKFIDGNVKAQDKYGNFKHSQYYEGTPAELTQPGYTENWKNAVAREHGEIIEVR